MKFGTSRLPLVFGCWYLKHALPAKVVDQGFFFWTRWGSEVPAHDRQVLSKGSVTEELPHKVIAVAGGFGKEQHSGREAIDAVNDERFLPFGFEFIGQQGPRRGRHGILYRDGYQPGRLVYDDDRVVFIHDFEGAGKTRRSPVVISPRFTAFLFHLWGSASLPKF